MFLDFQKTFDAVNSEIIVGKLNHYGVRVLSLDWFKPYLTNSQQKISIKVILSNSLKVSYGVRQGSILTPLLFLIDLHH